MASTGGNLHCVDCHAGRDHRVRGRGADLSGTDLPGEQIGCDTGECHGPQPHGLAALDHHTERIACTVCHIPTFAKSDPTDMRRDWSTPHHLPELGKYSATIELQKDVTPVYAWFNGKTRSQLMGEEIHRRDDGMLEIMAPEGARDDEHSKLNAFKLHRGVLPVLDDKQWLIPLAVEEFFADGDLEKAVAEGAAVAYDIHDPRYSWVETVRYMGIFHEVVPARQALGCLDCHREGGRMDWTALGYERDPLLAAME
jgi:hypothetical protein